MSAPMHSAGPWICYADLPSTEPNWHIVTTANRMRVLANVHIEPGNKTDEANARLIAAAPELLNSLCQTVGLAEEAIALRAESDDPDDHELLPDYQAQLATARTLISQVLDTAITATIPLHPAALAGAGRPTVPPRAGPGCGRFLYHRRFARVPSAGPATEGPASMTNKLKTIAGALLIAVLLCLGTTLGPDDTEAAQAVQDDLAQAIATAGGQP